MALSVSSRRTAFVTVMRALSIAIAITIANANANANTVAIAVHCNYFDDFGGAH